MNEWMSEWIEPIKQPTAQNTQMDNWCCHISYDQTKQTNEAKYLTNPNNQFFIGT